ncbi:N-acetyltransferase [Paenibacillus sp. SC116]|uniref:GNAT family N-acetyltransferase n=1 Tax=Paenibacillus sp. SC116 TaxID=2968986 RepID=UPI00215B0683|nr:N-acetyltransferase [Paenibacillus sp. SC116]MCR8845898.1 N-acetyltransferase [Paenibacillus sp. SC116]
MMIRVETPQDYAQVYALHDMAFNNKDEESALVERIRKSDTFVPELSLVAVEGEDIIGHVLLSKAHVVAPSGTKQEVLVLAPIGTKPTHQKLGVGSKLMEEGLKRAAELEYPLVLLIGHPDYYPKFGFVPARTYGLELTQFPVPDNVFMVRELQEGLLGTIQGELQYPACFF